MRAFDHEHIIQVYNVNRLPRVCVGSPLMISEHSYCKQTLLWYIVLKAKERKARLHDSYLYQKFLAEYRWAILVLLYRDNFFIRLEWQMLEC